MILETLEPKTDKDVEKMLEINKIMDMPLDLADAHVKMWGTYISAKQDGDSIEKAWRKSLDSVDALV